MARAALVDIDIDGGRSFIEALDAAGFPVTSAFWFFHEESEEWRLMVCTPVVDKEGPLKAYRSMHPVLAKLSNVTFRIDNIVASGVNDTLVKALRRVIRPGPEAAGVRLRRIVIGETSIHDSYIYRLQ